MHGITWHVCNFVQQAARLGLSDEEILAELPLKGAGTPEELLAQIKLLSPNEMDEWDRQRPSPITIAIDARPLRLLSDLVARGIGEQEQQETLERWWNEHPSAGENVLSFPPPKK